MLPMEFAGVSKRERRERAVALLEQVGLKGDKQQRRPAKLSGGEQQRVAIARALANRPKLILADEPTGNLDTKTGRVIVSLLHGLARSEDTTILAVTHDLARRRQSTDMTFEMEDGKLVAGAGRRRTGGRSSHVVPTRGNCVALVLWVRVTPCLSLRTVTDDATSGWNDATRRLVRALRERGDADR